MSPQHSPKRATADAVCRSFVSSILDATVEDVPMLRMILGTVASASSLDRFTRSLSEIRDQAPAMLAGCTPEAKEALRLLGDLIEDLEGIEDQALYDSLQRFAHLMILALERCP